MADVEAVAELRAVVLRPDLERLGRYDEQRVRQRLRDRVHPSAHLDDRGGWRRGRLCGAAAGEGHVLAGALLPGPDLQGKGIGTAVLSRLLEWCNLEDAVVRLNVLQGSSARRLYERHGFTAETEDEVDVFMARHSSSSGDHPVETRPGGSSSRRTASRSQGAVTVPSGFRGLVHESSWFRTPAPRHRA